MKKKIILQNKMIFKGEGFNNKKTITELVFNTSMVGYQEIISDNSYCGQSVVMTYPLIGNYGINNKANESVEPFLDALIVKQSCVDYSHFEAEEDLKAYLERFDVDLIQGVDTRALTRVLRDHGSQMAMIVDEDYDVELAFKELDEYIKPTDEVKRVSIKKPYVYENIGYNLVVIDCGIKLNILRKLKKLNFNITVLPYDSDVKKVMSYNPDGIFLSNGPGNPKDVVEVQKLVKNMQGKIPIFGICLGHQVIGLANGCEVEKLKFGHRGANHPVKNILRQKVEITSQNHSYTLSKINEKDLEITHINLLDNTCEGIRHKKYPLFSVQYHPESCPGPEDSEYLFDEFIKMIKNWKELNA